MGNLCSCYKTPETVSPSNVESNKHGEVKTSSILTESVSEQLPEKETKIVKTTEENQSNYDTNNESLQLSYFSILTSVTPDTVTDTVTSVKTNKQSEQPIDHRKNEKGRVEISNAIVVDNQTATAVKSVYNLPQSTVNESETQASVSKINKVQGIHTGISQKQDRRFQEILNAESGSLPSCSNVNKAGTSRGKENQLSEVLNGYQWNNQTITIVQSIHNSSAIPKKTNKVTKTQTRASDTPKNPLLELKLVRPSSNISFITNYIREYANYLNWEGDWASQSSVKFFRLNRHSSEYEDLELQFKGTNKWCFEVTQIERIQNPYLLAAFLLKQEEMENRNGYQDIEYLFHGTKNENVMNICTDNLDWRLYGRNVGNKFGRGISFTPISNYATHYSDDRMNNRIMLLVHVLIGQECEGSNGMVIPPDGYDTTIKPDRNVIVKYEDNEFYPAYKITYRCTDHNELESRRNNKRGNYNNGRGRRRGNNKQHFERRNYY